MFVLDCLNVPNTNDAGLKLRKRRFIKIKAVFFAVHVEFDIFLIIYAQHQGSLSQKHYRPSSPIEHYIVLVSFSALISRAIHDTRRQQAVYLLFT